MSIKGNDHVLCSSAVCCWYVVLVSVQCGSSLTFNPVLREVTPFTTRSLVSDDPPGPGPPTHMEGQRWNLLMTLHLQSCTSKEQQ